LWCTTFEYNSLHYIYSIWILIYYLFVLLVYGQIFSFEYYEKNYFSASYPCIFLSSQRDRWDVFVLYLCDDLMTDEYFLEKLKKSSWHIYILCEVQFRTVLRRSLSWAGPDRYKTLSRKLGVVIGVIVVKMRVFTGSFKEVLPGKEFPRQTTFIITKMVQRLRRMGKKPNFQNLTSSRE